MEVEIGKEAVQGTDRVAGAVRREKGHVKVQTGADGVDAATGTTATSAKGGSA